MTGILTPYEDSASFGDELLPSYSDEGKMLVKLYNPGGGVDGSCEADLLDYDGCVHWISEGMGLDFWLSCYVGEDEPGTYLIEGITGAYIRGDRSWGEDDDEEWNFASIKLVPDSFDCLLCTETNLGKFKMFAYFVWRKITQ